MLRKDSKCLDRRAADSTDPHNGGLQAADAEPDAGTRDLIAPLRWETLVQRIQADDPRAVEELYEVMNGGVRFSLVRRMPFHEVDDRIHDIFIIVLRAIQTNQLRESARLMGFIWTVAQRQVVNCIADAVTARRAHVPLGDDLECGEEEPSEKDSPRQSSARSTKLVGHRDAAATAFRRGRLDVESGSQRICHCRNFKACP